MSTMGSRLIITGLLLVFTLISGVWLSNSGKPLNVVIFTIHKLIALATVIITAVTINHLSKEVGIGTGELGAIIVTGLLFLFLFISGGWLSLGKPVNVAILTIHKVTPLLATISIAATFYLLVRGKL